LHWSDAVWQKYGVEPQQTFAVWFGPYCPIVAEGEQYPPEPQSESTAQLPPTSHTFATLSVDNVRQTQGIFDPHCESVKHSS
jgi:hypothetical protein